MNSLAKAALLWQKKLRRAVQVIAQAEGKSLETIQSRQSTKSVVLLHFSNGDEGAYSGIRTWLETCGPLQTMQLAQGSNYGYAEFRNLKDAEKAVSLMKFGREISGKGLKIAGFYTNLQAKDFTFYRENSAENVNIPGISFFPSFISDEFESILMANFRDMKWIPLTNRKVQYWGKAMHSLGGLSQLPEWAQLLKEKVEKQVNLSIDDVYFEYFAAGDSSAATWFPPDSHESTVSILNIGSPGVYSFQSHSMKTSLWLPRKSLLVCRDAGQRYQWSVQGRQWDAYQGFAVYRKDRYAVTFRKTRHSISMSDAAPLSPDFLQRYVYSTYRRIAAEFDHTRHRMWPEVRRFLQSLPPASVILDIGCGNGKYTPLRSSDCIHIGIDISPELAQIVNQKGYMVIQGDALSLPIQDNSVSAVLLVAVIHHFPTEEMRLRAVNEALRVLEENGSALIYVWAKEQSERVFDSCDCLLPWTSPSNLRFYHVFQQGELDALISQAVHSRYHFHIERSYYDHSNWCVLAHKRINSSIL